MKEPIDIFKRKYKYAADYGLILGGYIAIFFILDFLFPGNNLVGLLGFFGFLATPVVSYHLAVRYRDKAWGGFITFGQVWAFGIWLFFFAALLMSTLYYIRFEFLQPDYIKDAYNQFLIQAEKLYTKEQMDMFTSVQIPTTIELVLSFLWFYIVGSALLFLIVSPMVVRKSPNDLIDTSKTEKPYEPYQDKNDSNELQS